MHVLEELARERKLLCPDTGAPVRVEERRVLSDSGRELGEIPGPLNFLKAARAPADLTGVPAKEVERVRSHLKLPPGPEVESEIAKAIAWTGARFEAPHLSAEARLLAERFRIPEFDLGAMGRQTAMGRVVAAVGARLRGEEARVQVVRHSVGEHLTVGREVYRSVRLRNTGTATLRSDGLGVAHVDTRWCGQDAKPIAEAQRSNALPVDIEPGRELTLILRIKVPAVPGPHVMHLHLVAPGAPSEPVASFPIQAVLCDLPVFDYAYHPQMLEYDADHRVANDELRAFLAERYAGRAATVLEIGGGVHPMGWVLANEGHRVIAADISHAQSILGALYFRHAMPALRDSLAFLSCDGVELPFADETLDGVTLFAAFHHFADPVELLRQMKRVIRPDGFIYIACDCCAPSPEGADYLEELRRGINEQMWTLPEYAGFFAAAGLEVARCRIDFHSIKVAVVKRPASATADAAQAASGQQQTNAAD